MNEMIEEQFKKHCERSETLVANRKNRLPSQGKGLFYAFELYNLLNVAFDRSSIAKHHMIGMIAFLEGIDAPKEQGGLINPLHLELLETLAGKLARWIRPDVPERTKTLFSKAVPALLILSAALAVFSARQMKKGPKKFRDELLLRFIFGTGALREPFLSVIEGLDGEKEKNSQAADLLESIVLCVSLLCLQGENISEEIVHGLRPHIIRKLQGAKIAAAGVKGSQYEGLIEAMAIALDHQDYDRWISDVKEILNYSGSAMNLLLEDLAEIGRITETVLEAYQVSKENRPNMIHMLG